MGILFLLHSGLKFFVFTPEGTEKYFISLGLPGWFGIFVIFWEFAAGTALILGIWPRLAALLIAPDLIGFGRSDKPAEIADHTYARHVDWTARLAFDALDLRGATLVGQDWGGLIGLRLVAEHPDRFARVVAANTGLPTGDHPMPDVWVRFRDVVATSPELSISRLVAAGCQSTLSPEVLAAYDAPFPGPEFIAGPRAMPALVPTRPDDPASDANRAAWERLTEWDKPFLVAFGDSDPITGGMAPILKRALPGAADLDHPVPTAAGHFPQEDAGARPAAGDEGTGRGQRRHAHEGGGDHLAMVVARRRVTRLLLLAAGGLFLTGGRLLAASSRLVSRVLGERELRLGRDGHDDLLGRSHDADPADTVGRASTTRYPSGNARKRRLAFEDRSMYGRR